MAGERHRPGPWTVTPGLSYGLYWLREEADDRIGDRGHAETRTANARLISHAPAMAQALLDLMDWAAWMGGFESEVWDVARAALYAARGWTEDDDPMEEGKE